MAQRLEAAGVDLIELSGGSYEVCYLSSLFVPSLMGLT
jgi:hypothetical protein